MITGTILKQIAPSLSIDKANYHAGLIEGICPHYAINTPGRLHEFLANILEETGEFSVFEENLNYQAVALTRLFNASRISVDDCYRYGRTMKQPAQPQQIANLIYGGPWGLKNLGNTKPGDGWLFRGGGEMQLTGRSLTTRFTVYFNNRFETHYTPEQMADLLRTNREVGLHSACWFWSIVMKLNDEADADAFTTIVKKVNGGLLNMDKRLHYYNLAKALIK